MSYSLSCLFIKGQKFIILMKYQFIYFYFYYLLFITYAFGVISKMANPKSERLSLTFCFVLFFPEFCNFSSYIDVYD